MVGPLRVELGELTAIRDLDGPDTDWALLAELIETSYRQVANRRQLAALDVQRPEHAGR